MGVQQAALGFGVKDTELCQVLEDLDIAPGKSVDKAAIERAQAWVGLD